jgi:hypothetical protein
VTIVPKARRPKRAGPKKPVANREVWHGTIVPMDGDGLISRAEATAMLFAFADINGNVRRVVQLLEDDDGEEEAPEDDS